MSNEASLEDIQHVVQIFYRELRAKLFGRDHPSTPARVIITMLDEAKKTLGTGYDIKNREIVIELPEADCEDASILHPTTSPVLMSDIIEELLHEHERVIHPPVTDVARELNGKYGWRTERHHHGENFFASVELLAPLMGQTPDRLARRLTRHWL